MAMAVAQDHSFAITASADNLLVKYDLKVCSSENAQEPFFSIRTRRTDPQKVTGVLSLPSIQEMVQFPSGTMVVSALWEGGTESECSFNRL